MSYIKGRNLEYRIKYKLEKQGYVVQRSAGSHGIDLIALKKGEKPLLISCKYGEYVPPSERKEMLELAEKAGGIALYTKRNGKMWELSNVEL